MRRFTLAAVGALLLAGLPFTSAAADTVTTACTNATYVSQAAPGANYGNGVYLRTKGTTGAQERAFIECPVAGIPAGATGVTASLGLFNSVVGSPNPSAAHTVRLHAMTVPFAEGTAKWSTGLTYDPAVLSSVALPNTAAAYTLAAPSVAGNGTYRFALDAPAGETAEGYTASDDHSDPAKRPKLTVTYSLTPAAPVASFAYTPTSGEAPLAVQFTDTSTGGPTAWTWDFGDGTASTLQNPAHTYTAAGTYTATLTAANAGGTTTSSQTVTVTAAPPPTGPTPTVPAGTVVPGTLAFGDDFNGTAIDTAKWNTNWHAPAGQVSSHPNSSMTNCYDPANLSLDGGDLVIRTEQRPCVDYWGNTWQWASGLINTDGKYNPAPAVGRPVFVEWRDVEIPPNDDPLMGAVGSCGPNWLGYWLTGQSWPATGEIDAAECLGDGVCFSYHSAAGSPTDKSCPVAWEPVMPATAGNRHTVGVLWETDKFTVFYDGVKQPHIISTIEAAPKYIVAEIATSGTKVRAQTTRHGAIYAWQD